MAVGCAVEITQFCAATSQITQLLTVRGIDKANQRDSNPALCMEKITQLCAALLKTFAPAYINSPVSMSCSLTSLQMKECYNCTHEITQLFSMPP